MKNLYMLILAILPVSLFAQNAILSTDTTKVPEIELGEIIINGSKSDIKLKDLPSSVSLMTQRTIKDDAIFSLTDVTAIAPNLFMPDYGSKLTSPIYIRGIGSRINSPGVGLYVDGVPYFEKASFNFDFFDIDRIEVLRGPQGTLYGRNTIGGVVNIKTISPFDFQGAKVKIGYGNFGQYEANAGYYAKINENLAASVTAMYKHFDGFYTNEYTDKQIDETDVYSGRAKVIWNVTNNFSISAMSSLEYSNEGGYPYAIFDTDKDEANEISYGQPSSYERLMSSNALQFKYETDKIEAKLTSSYQFLDGTQSIDQDFMVDTMVFVDQEQTQHMISNELIVRSKNSPTYNWLIGYFNFNQSFDQFVDAEVYFMNYTTNKYYDIDINGHALFHESRLTLGDLTITGGLRIDYEKDKQKYIYDRIAGGTTTNVDDTVGTLDFFQFLPKIAFNYKFNGTNLYGAISKGYKTGGFNTTFDEGYPEHMTFDPETSINYEIGVKTSLLNKQLYADLAVFYIDWDQQQIYQTNPSGYGSRITNAGKSVSQGVELSLKTIPFCGYVTTVSYGFTHATFNEYVVDSAENFNGNFIPYAPQHTVSVRLSKSYQLHNSNIIDRIRISLLYTGNGKIFWNEENTMKQKYYGLFNAKISFIKDNFALNFYRKNMFNTQYHTFAFEAFGNQYVQLGRPTYFGASLTYNF